jgi:ABC-2 type transport system ATP-binding protein
VKSVSQSVPAVEARGVSRAFGAKLALQEIDLTVSAGQIHALLGPNGAGKTTLLRILTGLVHPNAGSVHVLGHDAVRDTNFVRRHVGLIPSGDRSFYLRLSGLENLLFFARMHSMRKREAIARALDVLEDVGLSEAAKVPVGNYSHGMHKRLSVARALLTEPALMLVDEATHDLDPEGARRVRDLIAKLAAKGTGVLWTTQRVDEIRSFADEVTLLDRGRIRFTGSIPALMAMSTPRRYLVGLRNGGLVGAELERRVGVVLGEVATVASTGTASAEHYVLSLADGALIGDAIAALAGAEVSVFACREEKSEIEEAFLTLTDGAST